MSRLTVIVGSIAIGLLACSPPSGLVDVSPSPTNGSPGAIATPLEIPSAALSIEPSAAPPSLTPVLAADDGGSWTAVEGSELVAPNAVAAPAGDRGVLLVSAGPGDADPCEVRERSAGGTPAAFYDSTTGSIERVSGDVGLRYFALAAMRDGRVMAAGGDDPADPHSMPTRRTRIWDPDTRDWSEGAPMEVARAGAALLPLGDGRLMAIGGEVAADEHDCEDCTTETDAVEIYDPATERWRVTAPVELLMRDTGDPDDLSEVIALDDGQVLALGSNDSASLFDPETETWTAIDWRGGWFGMVELADASVLSFGFDFSVTVNTELDLPVAMRSEPTGATATIGHWGPPDYAPVVVLADGRVFIPGGVIEDANGYLGAFLARAVVFDPVTGSLSEVAPMPGPRAAATAVPLGDGSALVVGGIDVWETQPGTADEEGNDTPGCVPVDVRVVRWSP